MTVTSNAAGKSGDGGVERDGGGGGGGMRGCRSTVTVRAGTQPMVGASVQMYAAGTSGNGSAGTALLATGRE